MSAGDLRGRTQLGDCAVLKDKVKFPVARGGRHGASITIDGDK